MLADVLGFDTSDPTSWTSAPVVPVISTARTDPPAARQVPTFTSIGAADPAMELMDPTAWKAGPPPDVV